MEGLRRWAVEEAVLAALGSGLSFGAVVGAALYALFREGPPEGGTEEAAGMGNRGSSQGCVVEVAPADLDAKWRPLRPVAEVLANSELESCAMEEPWRITINPAAELGPPDAAEKGRPSQSSSLSSSPPSSSSDWSEEPGVRRRRSYRIKRITLTQPSEADKRQVSLRAPDGALRAPDDALRTPDGALRAPDGALRLPRLQLLQAGGFSHADFLARLHRTADGLYGTHKVMTSDEAKTLVLLLESRDAEYLLKALTIVCNLSAFTLNQELLRECGVLGVVQNLLEDNRLNESQRIMCIQALSNLAVNNSNQALLQVRWTTTGELERLVATQALTNLTLQVGRVEPVWVAALGTVVPAAWGLVERATKGAALGGLKLLINLSCWPELGPALVGAAAGPELWPRLLLRAEEEVVVRGLTLLCRLGQLVLGLGLGEGETAPPRSVLASLRDPDLLPLLRRLQLLQGETAQRAQQALALLPALRPSPHLPVSKPAAQ